MSTSSWFAQKAVLIELPALQTGVRSKLMQTTARSSRVLFGRPGKAQLAITSAMLSRQGPFRHQLSGVPGDKGHSMSRFSFLVFAAVLITAGSVTSSAVAGGSGSCPPWRPCGAGNSFGGNRLVPQGFFGVDFRPACATHDACLASGASRRDCDRRFYGQLKSACSNSSNPALCRAKAFQYFVAVRLFSAVSH